MRGQQRVHTQWRLCAHALSSTGARRAPCGLAQRCPLLLTIPPAFPIVDPVQADAVNLLAGAKTQHHPENTVGVMTMAGKTPQVQWWQGRAAGGCTA